jgi:putative protease
VYGQKGQKKRFFSCQDLSLDVLVKVLLAIPQVAAWKIEGRKKGPHYVYHTVKAYRLLRDHGTDPDAKKEALGLLAMSLGRPGTHYRFLSQRMQNPVKTEVQTGSGLMVGRIKGAQRRPYLISRKPLFPGDVLRLGYEDERWHGVQKVRKFVPKKGRLDLRAPSSRLPKRGIPVFLVDRRDKQMKQSLSELDSQLMDAPRGRRGPSTFRVKVPVKRKKRTKPTTLHVYRHIPGSSKQRVSKKRGSVGIWLSSQSLKAVRHDHGGAKLWWWLPPVLWPKDEGKLKALLGQALKAGGRHFVLNAPWQSGLFRKRQGLHLWAGPFCNLANALSMSTVSLLGCGGAIVSPELGEQDLLSLPKQSPIPLGIVIGGNWPLTISRAVSRELQADRPFKSPRGEGAWVHFHGQDCWTYPNWVLDLKDKKDDLQEAGYCLFVHLHEFKPESVRMKKRPGLWNWELGLP